MVLLSNMMRMAAITGSTDHVFTRIAGHQGGQWAERTVQAAVPRSRPPAPRTADEALAELARLHELGVITDAELERLRARV